MDENKLTVAVGLTILALSGFAAMLWVLIDGAGAPDAARALLGVGLCALSCSAAAGAVAVK